MTQRPRILKAKEAKMRETKPTELLVVNEATDGWDEREDWTVEQVLEFNERFAAAVRAGRNLPKR